MIFLKSIIYRIFASSLTAFIAFILTGNLTISFGIGIFEFVSKVFAYYVFEKLWNKLIQIFDSQKYRQNCFKLNKSGMVILISGLNCSGKTSLAKELVKKIPNSIMLDGDAIRTSINYDLGFSAQDIRTNLTKISNLANLLNDQGYNVIISCISKKKNDRLFMKEILKSKSFFEIHTYCPDNILKSRQEILHPETKVLQADYEKSDYEVLEVDSSKNMSKNVEDVLCLIQKV